MFDANKTVCSKLKSNDYVNYLSENQILDFDTWIQDNKPKINNNIISKNYNKLQ